MKILLLVIGIAMFLAGMLLRGQSRSDIQKCRLFSMLAYLGFALALLGGILLAEPVLSRYPSPLVAFGAIVIFFIVCSLLFRGLN